jgi:hypothetical protein
MRTALHAEEMYQQIKEKIMYKVIFVLGGPGEIRSRGDVKGP